MFKNLFARYEKFMKKTTKELFLNIGLLFLRISLGLMMLISHGWDKFVNFADKSAGFPDPLGVSNAGSLALIVFAEVFCSIALMLGFATRVIIIPLILAMFVAAFVTHGDDPWARKEFAVLYLVPYIFLFFSGAGKYSVDNLLSEKLGTGD